MNLDLDKLEQLAQAAGADDDGQMNTENWYCERDIGNVLDVNTEADAQHIIAASPAVVLELVRQVRVLTAQAEALHKVGGALGLLPGADLTTDAAPAALKLVRQLAQHRDVHAAATAMLVGIEGGYIVRNQDTLSSPDFDGEVSELREALKVVDEDEHPIVQCPRCYTVFDPLAQGGNHG